MKKQLFTLLIASLGITTLAHAEGYSSSSDIQQDSTTIWQSKNKRFSISINAPGNEHRHSGGYYSSNDNPSNGYYSSNDRPRMPHWVSASNGFIPHNTVVGGYENNHMLYVCKTNYNGGAHTGKIVGQNCNFGWGGREVTSSHYETLVSRRPLNWVPAQNGMIPGNAIPGGFENGHPLYICQANYEGGTHPGKIVGSNCNFGYGGREVSVSDYNVLAG